MFTLMLTIESPDGSTRREVVVQNTTGVDDAARTVANTYPGWGVVAWRHATEADPVSGVGTDFHLADVPDGAPENDKLRREHNPQ